MTLQSIDKAYLYMNWRLAGWFKGFFDDGLYVWKAALTTCVLEYLFVFQGMILFELIFKYRLIPQDMITFALPFSIGVTVFNYFVFIRRWKTYETEYKNYSRGQHLLYGWIIGGIILFVFSGLIGSYYLLSQSSLAYGN